MPFYEVIYEDGSHSVMCTDSEEEMLEGVSEHHRRAKSGEYAGPAQDVRATRVAKVLEYDKHPNDFNLEESVAAAEVRSALKDSIDTRSESGVVLLPEVLADLRNLTNPMVDSGPHDSNFKLEEVKSIKPEKWEGE